MMDKRSVLAIALSGIVLVVWQMIFPYVPPEETEIAARPVQKEIVQAVEKSIEPVKAVKLDSNSITEEFIITVEDEKTQRVISSTNGVHFKDYFVKKYFDINDESKSVSLINEIQGNQFFPTLDLVSQNLALNTVNFKPTNLDITSVQLSEENPKETIEFVAVIEGNPVYKRLTFEYGFYDYNVTYDFSAIEHLLREKMVTYTWINGMPYTESVVYDDKNMSLIYVEGADDYYRFDTADNESETLSDPEYIKNITIRTKYFMSSFMPTNKNINKVSASQKARPEKRDDVEVLNYSYEITSDVSESSFNFYVGPYDRYEMANERYDYADLDNMFFSASGYENFFSFFSKGVHLFIVWLNGFIGSFGISILLFTILIKTALFPLTKKSYQGMKAMQEVQPKMAKLKEKYGHDPRLMQEKTMAFYREEGVNPMGSCLPMFLQMPLLMALFHVFRGAIEFRGASFLWIDNLAAPDALGIGLDSIGFATLNVLPILVAVSQIGMAKLQPSAPGADQTQQKMMQYMMPVMFLFMFYKFSAALNYYYFLFNVFTTVQQKFIHAPEKTIEVKEVKTPKGSKINDKNESVKLQSKNKKNMYKKKD